jgi:hypothetical protein
MGQADNTDEVTVGQADRNREGDRRTGDRTYYGTGETERVGDRGTDRQNRVDTIGYNWDRQTEQRR